MKYWLTVHWPKLEDNSEQYPLRIWLQDGKESVGQELSTGDRVLIYETKFGPSRRLPAKDGAKREVALSLGRQGIIAMAEATGPFEQNPSFEEFEYADGSKRWWCWHAPLTLLQSDGYVSLSEVNRVMGYSSKYPFRGFGSRSSGLKEITEEQYANLTRLFQTKT